MTHSAMDVPSGDGRGWLAAITAACVVAAALIVGLGTRHWSAILYFAMALLAGAGMPHGPLAYSIFALGLTGGVFALSGACIYDLDPSVARLHLAADRRRSRSGHRDRSEI
jgi:hypothetical protein